MTIKHDENYRNSSILLHNVYFLISILYILKNIYFGIIEKNKV